MIDEKEKVPSCLTQLSREALNAYVQKIINEEVDDGSNNIKRYDEIGEWAQYVVQSLHGHGHGVMYRLGFHNV